MNKVIGWFPFREEDESDSDDEYEQVEYLCHFCIQVTALDLVLSLTGIT